MKATTKILLFMLICAMSLPVLSQPKMKIKTGRFLNKTNVIIHKTKMQVAKYKVYTGALKKAVELQKLSIAHYKKQEYKKALVNSYKARRFSFIAFRANKGKVPQGWRLTPKEKEIIKEKFEDKDLEDEISDEDKKVEENDEIEVDDLEELEIENVEDE